MLTVKICDALILRLIFSIYQFYFEITTIGRQSASFTTIKLFLTVSNFIISDQFLVEFFNEMYSDLHLHVSESSYVSYF